MPGHETFELVAVDDTDGIEGAGPHDVVLLDLSLPGSDGQQTLRVASELTRAPIVVLTGSDDLTLEHDVLALGASDFIAKSEITGDAYRHLHRALAYAVFRAREAQLERLEHTYAQRAEHNERLATLGRLAAGIAHDLNNPLTYLKGNLEVLRETLADLDPAQPERVREACKDASEMLADADDAIQRMTRTARTYLELGALRPSELSRRPLDALVHDAVRFVRHELRSTVDLRLDLDATPAVDMASGRMVNVLVNLLMNANQALAEREQGTICVSTRVRSASIEIVVEDDGPGVTEAARRQIFTPFYTTRSGSGGTGLGLYFAAETLRAHGGSLRLDATYTDGARFVLSLPKTGIQAGAQEPGKPLRRRVLLVDDEPAILRAYRRLLSNTYEVVTASCGAESIAVLSSDDAFDAILCDIMMTGGDAIDLVDEVRRSHPHLLDRIIFLTAGGQSPRARQIHERFPGRVLAKPLMKATLEHAVESISNAPWARAPGPSGGTSRRLLHR